MTNENTSGAENKATWIERFGELSDVTPRESAKGEYVTFKMACGTFDQFGAAFGEEAIAFLKGAVGKRVWVKGPLNDRTVMKDGEEKQMKSFTVIHFKDISDAAKAAAPAEAEAEAA